MLELKYGDSKVDIDLSKAKSVKVGKLTLDHVEKFAKEQEAAGIKTDVVSPKLLPDYARKFD